jgi:hypothetical protein
MMLGVRGLLGSVASTGMLVGLVVVTPGTAGAVVEGSGCSSSNVIPNNPDAPHLQDDVALVLAGDRTTPDVEHNDTTYNKAYSYFCGVEPIPVKDGRISVRVEENPYRPGGLIYFLKAHISRSVKNDVSTTYYAEDDRGNVASATLTFHVVPIVPPVVRQVGRSRVVTFKNKMPIDLSVQYTTVAGNQLFIRVTKVPAGQKVTLQPKGHGPTFIYNARVDDPRLTTIRSVASGELPLRSRGLGPIG